MRLTQRSSHNVLGAVAPICGPLLRPLRVAALAAGLGLAPCAAVAQEFVELPQSIVPFGPGVTVVGPASQDAPVHFQVALKLRNFSELQDRLAAGQQVAYPELEQQFLPTEQDYGSVLAWLRGEGLTIERTVPDRITVAAAGTVASVSRALGVSFTHIISEGQEYVSANSAPKAPAALAGIVASVNGLQPHLHMNKLSILNPLATSGYSPAQIREAYAAAGLSETGANTTTAIIIDNFPNNERPYHVLDHRARAPDVVQHHLHSCAGGGHIAGAVGRGVDRYGNGEFNRARVESTRLRDDNLE